MENSVLDLWSIFDFLMPGYLGTAKDFRERYELPIAKEKNAEAQARLARRLRPFMLRRLKREVAADLPEKLELVSFCELTADQRNVYQQVIEASRKEVLAAVGEQGLAKSRMLVLTALLRLRQTCCDLRLLKPEGVDPATASGKLDLFSELLEEVIDGGHRVLVFSQFTGMLALLKERLTEAGTPYCYLDGSTTNRGAVVEKFQKDTAIPVFLISLKAGGVGLNLTGADTVIHFDPWWNPAVEDQATDRAYRIGQDKPVTVVRLVARGTIEEKILSLKAKKRELTRAVIGDDARALEGLTEEDVRTLLGDADADDDQDEDDEANGQSPADVLATARGVVDPEFDALVVEVKWWLATTGRAATDLSAIAELPGPFAARLASGKPFPCSRAVADRIRARLRAW
jgi:SNF2 family DNA or RNA helicase